MNYVLALDIGGTNVRAALIDEHFEIVQVIRTPTIRGDKSKFIDDLFNIIAKLNFVKYPPRAIVAGVPGRVRKNGLIDELPNIKIKNIDLINLLEEKFKLPIFIKNDAEMAAYAEATLGVGKNLSSTYFVTISTGLGGCLVVNNKLKNPSVEIGHTLFMYKGKFYELEKIASGEGLLNLARINGSSFATTKDFFLAVEQKNPLTLKIFDDWLDLLVRFFSYIQNAFTPDVIALTGGVLKSSHLFLHKLIVRCPEVNFKIAYFKDDAGLIGAAAYGLNILEVNKH